MNKYTYALPTREELYQRYPELKIMDDLCNKAIHQLTKAHFEKREKEARDKLLHARRN